MPITSIVHRRDPSIVLLGYGWDGADEGKMQSSFRIGRADFGNYLDVQRVSVALGYQGYGLSSLTAQVLGFPLPKPRKVRPPLLRETLDKFMHLLADAEAASFCSPPMSMHQVLLAGLS